MHCQYFLLLVLVQFRFFHCIYGVEENDIIKKINGEEINSIADIDKIVKSRKYYDPISIEILTKDNKLERFNFR